MPPASAAHDEAERLRHLANTLGPAETLPELDAALTRLPTAAELHLLRAVLLLALGRDEEAAAAARRVLYLDPSLAVAHLLLGSILWQRGRPEAARRAFCNAHDLCAALPADAIVPLSDGEPAGRLAEVASAQAALCGAEGGEA
jgi:chemotaxis protein methyltransferase CheR